MKITKSLSYAINWLASQNNTPEQIAEALKLTPEQVSKYLEKNTITKTESLPIKSAPVTSKSKDLMIRHTRDKKTNNVAIMTKEASAVNDDFKKRLASKTSDKTQDCIFRPNEAN
jgi:hypothetical protein